MSNLALRNLFLAATLTGMSLASPMAYAQSGAQSGAQSEAQSGDINTIEASADKTFAFLRGFLSLPAAERDKVSLKYFLKLKRGNLSDVDATMSEGQDKTKLNIAKDGLITPLPSLRQITNQAQIKVSGPDGNSPALRLKVVANLPSVSEYAASDLNAGLAQANRVATKLAGSMAFLLPKLTHVYFSGVSQATVVLKDGSQQALPKSRPTWDYPRGVAIYVPSAWPQAQLIKLGSSPVRIAYEETPKSK
jgi:hypothetical protein